MTGSDLDPTPADSRIRRAAIQSEIEDLRERLDARRRERFRHLFWAAIGISPAAVIPALGLVSEGAVGLLLLLSVLVVLRESWRAVRAGHDVRAWESQLEALEWADAQRTGSLP